MNWVDYKTAKLILLYFFKRFGVHIFVFKMTFKTTCFRKLLFSFAFCVRLLCFFSVVPNVGKYYSDFTQRDNIAQSTTIDNLYHSLCFRGVTERKCYIIHDLRTRPDNTSVYTVIICVNCASPWCLFHSKTCFPCSTYETNIRAEAVHNVSCNNTRD